MCLLRLARLCVCSQPRRSLLDALLCPVALVRHLQHLAALCSAFMRRIKHQTSVGLTCSSLSCNTCPALLYACAGNGEICHLQLLPRRLLNQATGYGHIPGAMLHSTRHMPACRPSNQVAQPSGSCLTYSCSNWHHDRVSPIFRHMCGPYMRTS
jgi:hypothetical protein